MKTLRTFFLILMAMLQLTDLSGQYEPMVDEDKFWIYKRYFSNDTPQVLSGFLINFEGDTIINNLEYKKVFHQGLSGTHPCKPEQEPCYTFDIPYKVWSKSLIGFIRENTEERKVYYRSVNGIYCDEEEYLLFDFALVVNDELDVCKKEAIGGEINYGIIDSIAYIDIFGDTRKAFHTFGLVTYIGLPYEGQVSILESVGFEKYGLFHSANNRTELHDYCEGSLSDCNIISNTQDLIESGDVVVYPNPANTSIFLKTKHAIKSAEMYTMAGRRVDLAFRDNGFDMSSLENGLYVIRIITDDGLSILKKVLKSN